KLRIRDTVRYGRVQFCAAQAAQSTCRAPISHQRLQTVRQLTDARICLFVGNSPNCLRATRIQARYRSPLPGVVARQRYTATPPSTTKLRACDAACQSLKDCLA